jgi:hypothetical protein
MSNPNATQGRKIIIRMNESYEWTTDPVCDEAPNNSAVIRIDDDGTAWFEEILVCNISPADLRDLAKFAATVADIRDLAKLAATLRP